MYDNPYHSEDQELDDDDFDEPVGPDPDLFDPAYCHNCGCWGKLFDDDTYICGNCGDEWARFPEPPEL